MKKEFLIYASLYEESKEGWVWIPPSLGIKSNFIKIKNPKTGKYIICEARILDKNYVDIIYNKRESTYKINNIDEAIVMNEYYRKSLDITTTQDKVELVVSKVNCPVGKYFIAPLMHPNQYVRVSIILAKISICLGILSILLSLFR